MGDEVERIVDGNTNDDTRDANHNHRHAIVHQRHSAKREKPAPTNGQRYEQYVAEPAESIEQQSQDKHGCQRNGQDAVSDNLPGIPHGNLRSAHHMCLYLWISHLHLADSPVEQSHKAGIHIRLTAAERRGEHHDGTLHVGREDIAVVHLEAKRPAGLPKLCHHRRKESQRVTPDILADDTARREHQGIQVILELPVHKPGLAEQAVHPSVVLLREEERDVPTDEIRHLAERIEVKRRLQVAAPACRIALFQDPGKTVYSLRRLLHPLPGGPGSLEDHKEAVHAGDVLIDLHPLPVRLAQGQEIPYILLVGQPRNQCQQDRRYGNK